MPGTALEIVEALAANPRPLARLAVSAFRQSEEMHRALRPFSPAELMRGWFDLLLANDRAGFAESFRLMTRHMRRLRGPGPLATLADRLDAELSLALDREGGK